MNEKRNPGRPGPPEPYLPKCLSCTQKQWDKARRVGDGSMSQGLRTMIDDYTENDNDNTNAL